MEFVLYSCIEIKLYTHFNSNILWLYSFLIFYVLFSFSFSPVRTVP